METIELRESDKRRAVNLNRKNGYGLLTIIRKVMRTSVL